MSNYHLDRHRLILCREKINITKQEAARRMQMSQPAYLRYESGERIPSVHILQTMAHVLGTSVEYLSGKTDDPQPTSYLIEAASDPELFAMMTVYQDSSSDQKKRLLEYFVKHLETDRG